MSERLTEEELVVAVTRVVRDADESFEHEGGSSRHWVRDGFLLSLRTAGLMIVREAENAALRARAEQAETELATWRAQAGDWEEEARRCWNDRSALRARAEQAEEERDEFARRWKVGIDAHNALIDKFGEVDVECAARARAEQAERERDKWKERARLAQMQADDHEMFYKPQVDALRIRVEQAEREKDEVENVADQYRRQAEVEGAGYLQMKAERDALRAEAGRLREALERLADESNWRMGNSWIRPGYPYTVAQDALSSTPLSATALERWRAMGRVVEAAMTLCALRGDVTPGDRQPLVDALAALSRTAPREGGETR